ncbi:MAG: GNAT family N-acetyltransferase [Akkermansiaceae bacterium]
MNETRIAESIVDGLWIWKAYYRGEYAGQLVCVPQDSSNLLFSDVKVSDGTQGMLQPPWWKRLIGMKTQFPDFQRKGIGSALTHSMLLRAKAEGISRIYGCIVQKDINQNPRLLLWYEKMGFIICEPDEECLGNAVKKIEMIL